MLTGAFNQSGPIVVVATKIFDGLIRLDSAGRPAPELAAKWDVSKDGREVRFRLRPNVRWHDGKPFTSADVKFTYEEVWMKLHPRARSTFAAVEALETPDPLTVVFRLRNPAGVIFSALTSGESQILPKHLYEGTDVLTNAYNVKPVGTGPFRFKEWIRGDRIVLERNPDYWDEGKPYLDKVIFRVIPDATTRFTAFETGAVDYGVLNPVALADLERAQRSPALNVDFRGYEWLGSRVVLEFNVRKPPFDDPQVRKAIAHAIDLKALSRATTRGYSQPGTSPVLSTQPKFYTPEVPSYAYDIAAADRLLDEAGYRRKADGQRMAIKLDWLPFGESYQRYGEFVRQSLRKIGFDVQLRGQDLTQYMQRVYAANDFDITVSHLANFGDPQIGLERAYWSKAIMKGVPWSNASGYSSPAMDVLIKLAHEAPDEAQRVEMYKRFQRLAMTDLPTFTLLENRMYTISSKRVRGLSVAQDACYDSLKGAWVAA